MYFSVLFPKEEFVYEDLKQEELILLQDPEFQQPNIERKLPLAEHCSDSLSKEFDTDWSIEDSELITEEQYLGMKS